MNDLQMTERHALKFTALGITQQQRVMKRLANAARAYAKESQQNSVSAQANHYDWQRKVRLSREARAVHLIRAFLKGVPYYRVENSLKFHTRPASIVVQEHMPFTLSTMRDSFSRDFNNWLLEEPSVQVAA